MTHRSSQALRAESEGSHRSHRAIALGLVDGAIVSLAAFAHPVVAIVAALGLVLIPFVISSPIAFPLTTAMISHVSAVPGVEFDVLRIAKWGASGLVLVLTIWQFALSRWSRRIELGIVEKYFIAFVLWGAVCLLITGQPLSSIGAFARYGLLYFVYLFTKLAFRTRQQGLVILWVFVGIVFISALYSLSTLFAHGYFRVRGFLDNANGYGLLLGFLLPMVISLTLITKHLVVKYFLMATVALGGLCLVLTWSRASIGGVVVQLVVALLITGKRKALMYSLVAVSVFGLFVYLQPDLYRLFYNLARLQAGSTYRTMLWEKSFKAISESPIFGHGFALKVDDVVGRVQWNDLSQQFLFHDAGGTFNPHNQYIVSALSTGVPGLVLLVSFLILLIRRLGRLRRAAVDHQQRALLTSLYCTCWGMVFVGMFEASPLFGSGSYANYFWISLGLAESRAFSESQ